MSLCPEAFALDATAFLTLLASIGACVDAEPRPGAGDTSPDAESGIDVDLSAFLIDTVETTERELQACDKDDSAQGFKCLDRIREDLCTITAAPDEPVRNVDCFHAATTAYPDIGVRCCADWNPR